MPYSVQMFGMIECRHGPRLADEAGLRVLVEAEIPPQELERGTTAEARILGDVDDAHAAGAQPADHVVGTERAADQRIDGGSVGTERPGGAALKGGSNRRLEEIVLRLVLQEGLDLGAKLVVLATGARKERGPLTGRPLQGLDEDLLDSLIPNRIHGREFLS